MNRVLAIILVLGSAAAAQTAAESAVISRGGSGNDIGSAAGRRLNQAGSRMGGSTVSAPAPAPHPARRSSRGHSVEGLSGPAPSGDAVVSVESAQVYRSASSRGTSVATLKQGEPVKIDFEFKTTGEAWCIVTKPGTNAELGYIACKNLRRMPRGTPTASGQPAATKSQSSAQQR